MNKNKQQLVYLYQLWPSNNRFFCKGHIMTGPKEDNKKNIITWFFIILIGVPFIFYISPQIWIVLHPSLPIISYVMYFSCILFLIMTQFTDPGIIPRKQIIERIKDENLIHLIPTEAENANYQIKICLTCMIKKPPRSNHCSIALMYLIIIVHMLIIVLVNEIMHTLYHSLLHLLWQLFLFLFNYQVLLYSFQQLIKKFNKFLSLFQ
ncbi:unnamed protein product [Paramecium sonneborni]|uniref:protein S-acyltransferase n=1 Tax=Paramecium sonneborni TaxID=65129 RepID=A0A8S1QSJ1_9CILI|nr:unnamed protein product [Paramecium sonneborni]